MFTDADRIVQAHEMGLRRGDRIAAWRRTETGSSKRP